MQGLSPSTIAQIDELFGTYAGMPVEKVFRRIIERTKKDRSEIAALKQSLNESLNIIKEQ